MFGEKAERIKELEKECDKLRNIVYRIYDEVKTIDGAARPEINYFFSTRGFVNAWLNQAKDKRESEAEREKIAKIAREECFAAPKTKKKSGK